MSEKTVWRFPTVAARTGLSHSTIYRLMARDEFPQSFALGANSVGWLADEIEQWIIDRALSRV
ncbi:MAG: AlpA family phage regulatory protein [Pseudomonadota bacterium]